MAGKSARSRSVRGFLTGSEGDHKRIAGTETRRGRPSRAGFFCVGGTAFDRRRRPGVAREVVRRRHGSGRIRHGGSTRRRRGGWPRDVARFDASGTTRLRAPGRVCAKRRIAAASGGSGCQKKPPGCFAPRVEGVGERKRPADPTGSTFVAKEGGSWVRPTRPPRYGRSPPDRRNSAAWRARSPPRSSNRAAARGRGPPPSSNRVSPATRTSAASPERRARRARRPPPFDRLVAPAGRPARQNRNTTPAAGVTDSPLRLRSRPRISGLKATCMMLISSAR